jgi:hypothetical protein
MVSGYSQEPKDTEDWSRKPELVIPGKKNKPPSDAIVLFDGKDFSKWTSSKGEVQWKRKSGAMEVVKGAGSIHTKDGFGDMQLHIEWRTPKKVVGDGQGRGNSGIFLMGLYEVQVLDSYQNETYYNGQAASIYKQHIPLVNACLPPGKWQVYDILFKAPVFSEDQKLVSPGYVTVIQNGVLVQFHVELKGPTLYIGKPEYSYHESKLPLMLQDHGNPVRYRNIWIRNIKL